MSKLEEMRQQNATQIPDHSPYMQRAESLRRQAAKEFTRALHRAEKAATCSKPELAVEWCRYAALLAWKVNPGFFYSHELEQLLAEIGRSYLGPSSASPAEAEPPRCFLHVMSAAYVRGGHTRVVARWIETCAVHAPSEVHSILISMQKDVPLPEWLGHSAAKTGGEMIKLSPGLPWLQLAAELRSRSMEFDAIVLHIHPNDPLPNIAYYDQPRPVLFFRHADHVFNLGLDVARVVADIRPLGRAMSVRFCAKTPRKVMLPLPLVDGGHISRGKAEARKKLGLPGDAIIALTIGEPYKFRPMHEYSFSALVKSLCEGNPRVFILAIGLSESDPFPGLGRSVGGRFMPVGVVADRDLLELYYRAADVYMDAYPSGSLTAALDAALHGVPVQRFCVPNQCMLWPDAATLDPVMRADSNQDEYVARVLEWLKWPEEKRLELGGRFRNAVLQDHCGASWKSKWLDPAIVALISPCDLLNSRPNGSQRDESDFPGLGKTALEGDSYADMLITRILIDPEEYFPRPIRISGIFHSIKPLLFDTVGDGKARERLSMFRNLVASCVPMQIRMQVRKIRGAIFRNSLHRSESIR